QSASIKPNVTFAIETTDGTLLQSYSTGDIGATTSPEWKQYSFYFKTPAGASSVVLRMTNNAPGGCGNDLLLDDITFRACGPLVTASIDEGRFAREVCEGNADAIEIEAIVSTGFNDPAFQWQLSKNSGTSWENL